MGNHYYDKEGNPRHDATMREVKKEDLLISVTTYLGLLAKPGLEKWKIEGRLKIGYELLKASGDLSLEDFMRAVNNIFDERNNAADIGTKVHDAIDDMVTNAIPLPAARDYYYAHAHEDVKNLWNSVQKAYVWFNDIVSVSGGSEETIVSIDERYAGRLDYYGSIKDPEGIPAIGILDWKTQNVKHPGHRKDGNVKAGKVSKYPEWGMQLGAYSKPKKAIHGYIGVIGTNPLFPFFKPYHY